MENIFNSTLFHHPGIVMIELIIIFYFKNWKNIYIGNIFKHKRVGQLIWKKML